MKTNVANTSIQSYDALRHGAMGNQHTKIILAMVPGWFYTRREIAKKTGLETATVAGRVNELIADGQLVSAGTKKCSISGRTVEALELYSPLLRGHI